MKRLLLGAVLVLAGAAVYAQTPGGEEGPFLGQRPEALSYDTVGPSPQVVTSPGTFALSIDGDFELGGFVFKDGQSFLHNDGGPAAWNTALGRRALVSTTPGEPVSFAGTLNTALGDSALRANTTGRTNTASGAYALFFNTEGSGNTATGTRALYRNTDGDSNTAVGAYALRYNDTGYRNTASGVNTLFSNTEGQTNTAFGYRALFSNSTGHRNTAVGADSLRQVTTGIENIAVGYLAGLNLGDAYPPTGASTYSYNIFVGSRGQTYDENTIRLGRSGTHTKTFVAGIRGVTGSFDEAVCTDAFDQLGPCGISPKRFKEQIRDMGSASKRLLDLRPVSFRFKAASGDAAQPLQHGLIAEEVVEVLPELVTHDDRGRPVTVRYQLLTPMLVNELQRQQRQIRALQLLVAAGLIVGVGWTAIRWRVG